jgi:hypothetical protein
VETLEDVVDASGLTEMRSATTPGGWKEGCCGAKTTCNGCSGAAAMVAWLEMAYYRCWYRVGTITGLSGEVFITTIRLIKLFVLSQQCELVIQLCQRRLHLLRRLLHLAHTDNSFLLLEA